MTIAVDRFRHEALLYADAAEFLAGTIPFVRGGIETAEAVLVVESPAKIEMLRSALGERAGEVEFADMAAVGANPARIIPAWRDFVDRHPGRRLRGIGEPIWNGRTPDELVECQRHESLLNVAFGQGQAWSLLCPYDTSSLDPAVVDEARRSHEYVAHAGSARPSHDFRGIAESGAPFDAPLSEPGTHTRPLGFDRDGLLHLRGEVVRYAISAGLSSARATEFVTAVNEVATNSILHGGGGGVVRMWEESSSLVCEVQDRGRYELPLADRERPGKLTGDARGLWLANQLCDLVQIRTREGGTVVRLHMKVEPRRHLRVVGT